MAADTQSDGPKLPPKLDLRKKGVLKPTPQPASAAPADSSPVAPQAATPAAPAQPKPVAPNLPRPGNNVPKPGMTVRLQPKIALSQAPSGGSPSLKPKPVVPAIKKTIPTAQAEPAVVPAAPVAAPADPQAKKKETSRIPLESAQLPKPDEQPVGPKTIRISPAVPAAAQPTVRPGTLGQAGAANDADPKRQTSRISLEAALGSDENQAPAPDKEEEDDSSDASVTQKKTIKVKRPTQRKGVKSVSVTKRPSVAAGGTAKDGSLPAAAMSGSGAMAKPLDGAHWTFITFSIVAILVTLVFIYVAASQAYGPNFSLTPLSYGAEEMELPWPGRLYR